MSTTRSMREKMESQTTYPYREKWYPIEELKPGTFVNVIDKFPDGGFLFPNWSKEKYPQISEEEFKKRTAKIFREFQLEELKITDCGGTSYYFNFEMKNKDAKLLGASISTISIYYVAEKKDLQPVIRINAFFATDSLRNSFINSLPKGVHVYSNEDQRYFHREGKLVCMITKSKQDYIAVLNKLFSFPEAQAELPYLFKKTDITANLGVNETDIKPHNELSEQKINSVDLIIKDEEKSGCRMV